MKIEKMTGADFINVLMYDNMLYGELTEEDQIEIFLEVLDKCELSLEVVEELLSNYNIDFDEIFQDSLIEDCDYLESYTQSDLKLAEREQIFNSALTKDELIELFTEHKYLNKRYSFIKLNSLQMAKKRIRCAL